MQSETSERMSLKDADITESGKTTKFIAHRGFSYKKKQNTIDTEHYLPNTIFISFNTRILKYIRAKLPEQPIQLLLLTYKQEYLDLAQESKFGIDISHRQLTKARIDECHNRGIEINCWTVNNSKRSKILEQWGVDYITTDKLLFSE